MLNARFLKLSPLSWLPIRAGVSLHEPPGAVSRILPEGSAEISLRRSSGSIRVDSAVESEEAREPAPSAGFRQDIHQQPLAETA